MNNELNNTTEKQGLQWEYDMPLLTNSHFMLDFAKIVLISPAICGVLIIIMSIFAGSMDIAESAAVAGYMFVVGACALAVLMAFTCLVVFKNKFHTLFFVDDQGVAVGVPNAQRRLNRIAVALGILSGKPGVVGASLLAQSQEDVMMPWEDVYHIDYFPSQRVITLKNTWRTVVRLYCLSENYEAVADTCRRGFDAAAGTRLAHTEVAKRCRAEYATTIKSSVLWMFFAIASAALVMLSPLINAPDYVLGALAIVLLGCFFGGSARKLLGVCGLVALAGVFVTVVEAGLHTTTDFFGTFHITSAEIAMQSHPAQVLLSQLGMLGLVAVAMRHVLINPIGRGLDAGALRKTLPTVLVLLVLMAAGSGIVLHLKTKANHQMKPEIQSVEINPWDTALTADFKIKYNHLIEVLRVYRSATAVQKANASTEYIRAYDAYKKSLSAVDQSGRDAEKQLVHCIDSGYKTWLRVEKISAPD